MQDLRPDVVLVAATGPVAELVARTVVAATRPHRPALISGLPGMALPATPFGTGWRRWSDAFVVHSHREVEEYRREFEAQGAHPRIALARLPFLGRPFDPAVPPTRLVFAPQSIVPASRTERVRLLDGLARVAATGSEVLVKLRARSGERQTHNEAFPLDQLWDAVHDDLGQPGDALRFVDGPMAEWLVPGTALATVSSTAALESLSLGLPTVLIDDFGVAPRLLNEPFIGSGCFASLDELPSVLAAGGPLPDSTWKQRNYLHTGPSELPAVVQELALARRSGDLSVLRSVAPFSWPRHMRTVVRSALPGAVTKRLVRPPR